MRPHSSSVWSHRSSEVAQLVTRTKIRVVLDATAQMVCAAAQSVNFKTLILSFACPIQLIPVPMVLVKIINGKFGIIEIFGNTQGYFGHFGDIFDIHL